jgi:transposase
METTTYTSKTLDHLGLIARLIQEIGISELVDSCYAEQSPDQKVSNGKALEAMIINGLGFVNKRLYLVPQFFEDKPISRLLGEGFEASQFNDDRLGRALEAFYETGVTPLFAKISRRTFEVLGRKPGQGHLDTTTLSAYGRYNSAEDEPVKLHITQGYSKDHRPDLAQATLQLICDNISGIPVHMQALNGNSNDSSSFREAIENFGKQLRTVDGSDTIVADSKLYRSARPEKEDALLNRYKSQHQVERGFRFIKDPEIVASSFYVKKPERVEALLFVRTTCLLVYAALEHRIRQALEQTGKTVADQKGKPTNRPTARWIFQVFVGIHVLELPDGKEIVLNLKQKHRDILDLISC